jgi:hypothetical protein
MIGLLQERTSLDSQLVAVIDRIFRLKDRRDSGNTARQWKKPYRKGRQEGLSIQTSEMERELRQSFKLSQGMDG